MKKILLTLCISFSLFSGENNNTSIKRSILYGALIGAACSIPLSKITTGEWLDKDLCKNVLPLIALSGAYIGGISPYRRDLIQRLERQRPLNDNKTEKKPIIRYISRLNSLDENPKQLDHEETILLKKFREKREKTGQRSYECPF